MRQRDQCAVFSGRSIPDSQPQSNSCYGRRSVRPNHSQMERAGRATDRDSHRQPERDTAYTAGQSRNDPNRRLGVGRTYVLSSRRERRESRDFELHARHTDGSLAAPRPSLGLEPSFHMGSRRICSSPSGARLVRSFLAASQGLSDSSFRTLNSNRVFGTPGKIRTYDLLLRRQTLYPV